MNSRELYLAFNAIDDDILEQSECEVQNVSFWRSHRLLKQCVAACLAVVIVFSGLMSVEACRKKIIEVITQVFPSFTYRFFYQLFTCSGNLHHSTVSVPFPGAARSY